MNKIMIKISNSNIDSYGYKLDEIANMGGSRKLYANVKDCIFNIKLKEDKILYIFGDVFYHITDSGKIKLLNQNSANYIKKLFISNELGKIITNLEGQYLCVIVDKKLKSVAFCPDRYARLDYFYNKNSSGLFISTELDYIFSYVKPEYDQTMLAHMFCVYGWYTPKKNTIYKNVNRIGVGEILRVTDTSHKIDKIPFKPLNIESYGDKDLERYYLYLRDSIIARSNKTGKTWVSSSSGWDSSIITGILVDELGNNNVGMITGSMKYSDTSDVINKFEIDKIKKVGEYYGIKPVIVDLDYKSKEAANYWAGKLPFYKNRHIYTFTSNNFSRLSDGLIKSNNEPQVILNGETSDSFHNFGFSQFVTFFHTVKSFTEYGDKMNCYLYGPTFLKKVLNGSYTNDRVYKIFKTMYSSAVFNESHNTKQEILEGYLFPLFYGSPRIPFSVNHKNSALTTHTQKAIYHFPFGEYISEALNLNEKNVYSWYIYLYHSFHSQGSTVNVQKHAMEENNHRWRSPYNDYRIIELLSKAPESWGRGLDFNNTKYPLKWVAKNKIKFPYDLLNTGPHSYLYDVIEGFSLTAEVVYRSGVTPFFKEVLAKKQYRNILSDKVFDVRYLDKNVDKFLVGHEVKGEDFNNLVSLITLCVTGWY